MNAALIGVDWGTSNLRAFRFGRDGRVLETRAGPLGIMRIENAAFEDALRRMIGDWLAASPVTPVLMCGMIGSRQGWAEAPYRRCPAGPADLAASLLPVVMSDGRRLHIVPGLEVRTAGVVPDVMRGEETQIVGALAGTDARSPICAPGTHSKWATVDGACVLSFDTYMTGEVFEVLKRHSILGRLMAEDAAPDADAFDRGVGRIGDDPRLLHVLFGVRSLGLFGEIPATGLASYLSGLLIGAEVIAALRSLEAGEVVLVGGGNLIALYRRAIEGRGRSVRVVEGEGAVARGLWVLAGAAGLTGEID